MIEQWHWSPTYTKLPSYREQRDRNTKEHRHLNGEVLIWQLDIYKDS